MKLIAQHCTKGRIQNLHADQRGRQILTMKQPTSWQHVSRMTSW